ncbi:AI-2E family transporter [Tundrisphaera sp. TA3]|uniref:AI-2E family transporter n=1 Tax=Tundrisphaera sp. TA3 TaxID=3435775 RepID=UPI003EBB085E
MTESPSAIPSATSLERVQKPFYRLALLVLIVIILHSMQVVLVPVALAVLLAFALSGPADFLEERAGLKRYVSVPIVMIGSLALMGTAAWVAGAQFRSLAAEIPKHRENLDRKLDPLYKLAEGLEQLENFGAKPDVEKRKEKATGDVPTPVEVKPPGSSGLSWLPTVAQPIVETLATTFLVLVLTTFFLAQRESLRDRLLGLVGRTQMTGTTRALEDAGRRVGQYLLLQLGTNAVVGVGVGVGLALMGVPYAPLWGLLTTLLRFLPYVGIWLSALGPILLSVALSPGWTQPFLILGLYVALDLLMANVVEPLLFSHGTGVSPVALLIAAVFWAWLWGSVGLLLATPLTVCLVVLGKHIPSLKFLSLLLGDESNFDQATRYYDRLLARDYDEAAIMLKDYARDRTADDVYDDVILPALAQAKTDREQRDLTEEQERSIYDVTGEMVKMMSRRPASPTAPAPTLRVLGCAVKGQADVLALDMLRDALEPAGAEVIVATPELLAEAIEKEASTRKTVAVCLTALSPGGLSQSADICRAIKAKFPDVQITVARWGQSGDTTQTADYLKAAGADRIGWTLKEVKAELTASEKTSPTGNADAAGKASPSTPPGPRSNRRNRKR